MSSLFVDKIKCHQTMLQMKRTRMVVLLLSGAVNMLITIGVPITGSFSWIYSIISTDLLATTLEHNSTAVEAWNHLADFFQDNQNARVATLDVSNYYQHLKMLSNQLRNVFLPINNHCMVLQLIFGLPEVYHSVATLIRLSNPLPTFYQARSMLTLEEADMAKMESIDPHAAMHTTQHQPFEDTFQRGNFRSDNRSCSNQGCGGDVVTIMDLIMELPVPFLHGLLLIGSSYSSTQLSNHGVELRHHGLYLCIWIPIMICDNHGDLYPITTPSSFIGLTSSL
ncbi:unnamed protein product [Vicia faba]|uniref:Uncharacterized protein n=1 Tax=Vicia faba TaxID=3906 RepID=A0AAV1APE7_VICFA|nr:unnamed protein product [Vicia faba]